MTNIEYYGFENLEFLRYFSVRDCKYKCDVYYKPKHAKKAILLKTLADKKDIKTKWLLEEHKVPFSWFSNLYYDSVERVFYHMRHYKEVTI